MPDRPTMPAVATEVRESDAKGQITLPDGFANSTLLVEQVSDVEIVIRKAKIVLLQPGQSDDEALGLIRLPAAEFDAFVAALDNPPPPTDALRRLMSAPAPKAD